MAVKTSWAAGDVLTAADLTDTFANKVNGSSAATAPSSPVTGQVWVNTSTNAIKVWSGSAWVDPSNAGGYLTAGDVSGTTGSPTISTTTIDGVSYTVYKFTGSSGSITLAKSGLCTALVAGGGGGGAGGGNAGARGGGGGGAGAIVADVLLTLPSGATTITVGAGGTAGTGAQSGGDGGASSIGTLVAAAGGGGGGYPGVVGNSGGCGGGGGDANGSAPYGGTGYGQAFANLVRGKNGGSGSNSC